MTATEARPAANPSTLLRAALMGNAAFSAVSGIALAAMPSTLSAILGFDQPPILASLGVGLVLFAVALFFVARQRPISRQFAWTAIMLDDAWVLASVALLMFAPTLFSPAGEWLIGAVAVVVAGFAVAQLLGVRRAS